jgi:alkylation response protein AidB-like acyl-CoA dehydrogenase
MAAALQVVEWGQVIQALCGIGAGEAALSEARRFVEGRQSFGRPLADNEVVQHHLDEAELELYAATLLARRAVAAKARGEVAGADIVMAKIFGTEAGVRACHAALTVCGGWGYSTEMPVERFLRDAYGNIPAGLPNDRLRELLVASRVGADPWRRAPLDAEKA